MNQHDRRDMLRVRMHEPSREVTHLLSPDSGLSSAQQLDVLDRLDEHAGWCQQIIEEYGDRSVRRKANRGGCFLRRRQPPHNGSQEG